MLTIRKAIPDDAGIIAELEVEAFAHPWSKESLLHDIENNELSIMLVAELDGRLAGYANVWSIAGEGQLNNIAVFEWAKGNHVGLGLMEAMLDELRAKGDSEMSLEVRVGNLPARSLYEKLDFENMGIRPGYYEDNGEDAVIYRKELLNA